MTPLHDVAWRMVTLICRPDSTVHSYLNPLRPPAWLVRRVHAIAAAFPALVDLMWSQRLAHLPDYDLETGEIPAARVA